MKKELSILLPTYNCRCKELVMLLQMQCEGNLDYEIIVADDGSPNRHFVEENRAIEKLKNVRYIIRKENVGRSAIRNFLANEAKYQWLLFIDGDLSIENTHFIKNYMDSNGDVVVGGVKIGGEEDMWFDNLRYRYEKKCEPAHTMENRRKNSHKEFRTTNFVVHKDIILAHPFEENVRHYGYEDVIFGKELCENNIGITHINNPVLIDDFECNADFLKKNEEALRTLHQFRNELRGYSKLLDNLQKIEKMQMLSLVHFFYRLFRKAIKHNLFGNNPSVFLFNVYKVLYYVNLMYNDKK
ncbi:MAG: glycosyltransferase [Prevotellaceae bacterium]|nr:glycosyltransferase [Prevotella sp.]MDD7256918.1 glycosyltransferase [Prevotellaceae bacterium]MDY6130825.1 glycosyltransferase [Prevotella sp.]